MFEDLKERINKAKKILKSNKAAQKAANRVKVATLAGVATVAGTFNHSDNSVSATNSRQEILTDKVFNISENPSDSIVEALPETDGLAVEVSAGRTKSTLQSPWNIVSFRESAGEDNPIGCISPNGLYYGYLQCNKFNMENVLHMGLLLGGDYEKFALQFYDTEKGGFDKAVAALKEAYAQSGNIALVSGSKTRKALASYVVNTNKLQKMVKAAGLGEDKELFLNLQQTYGNICYWDHAGGRKIEKLLNQKGIDIKDVDPAIIGMFEQHMIATGNATGIMSFLKNKNIRQEYLNSDTCVTDFKRFPRTICDTPTQIKENLGANNNETARHIAEMVSGEDRLKECLRTGMDWGMHQGQEFAKTNTTERADSAQQRSDSIIFRPVSEENIHATITKKSGNLSQIAFYRGQKQY